MNPHIGSLSPASHHYAIMLRGKRQAPNDVWRRARAARDVTPLTWHSSPLHTRPRSIRTPPPSWVYDADANAPRMRPGACLWSYLQRPAARHLATQCGGNGDPCGGVAGRASGRRRPRTTTASTKASLRSGVSKPSVNQRYTGTRRSRASERPPCARAQGLGYGRAQR